MSEYLSRRAGFAIVCLLVVFVAAWLAIRGTQAIQPAAQSIPQLPDSDDLKRFRAEALFLPNDPLLGFVKIPAGAFVMGSDPEIDRFAYANERWSQAEYQGKVELPEFYIARYEVTVAQFSAFVAATRRTVDRQALLDAPTHPVARVTWTDALAYARWLNATLRDSAQTPPALREMLSHGWKVSLPTEAQWEKAARGADARIYPWGAAPSLEFANFNGSGPKPVGSLRCSECAFQLADMSGNVWEMTRSPYRPYPFDAAETGAEGSDALFVMRGGSFNDPPNNVRSAIRGGVDPGARSPYIGFRVVIEKS